MIVASYVTWVMLSEKQLFRKSQVCFDTRGWPKCDCLSFHHARLERTKAKSLQELGVDARNASAADTNEAN